MNHSIERHPRVTIVSLMGCEIASLFAIHSLISASGWVVPPAFALGFVASKALRRVRVPLDLAFSAGMYKLLPELANIKMSALMVGQIPSTRFVERVKGMSGITTVLSVVDRFGACYFVGARWCGTLVTLGLTAAIDQGLDLEPVLSYFGVNPSLGHTLGSWAAAVTLSAVLYPATLCFGGVVLTPQLVRWRGQMARFGEKHNSKGSNKR